MSLSDKIEKMSEREKPRRRLRKGRPRGWGNNLASIEGAMVIDGAATAGSTPCTIKAVRRGVGEQERADQGDDSKS